jgi:hypothetical protein
MLRTLAAAATLILASSTACAQDVTFDLPAGLACPSLDLRLEVFSPDNRVYREFIDKKSNAVRLIMAGQGNTLKLTNLNTGASLTLRTDGSVERILKFPDGSQRWAVTGHNLLIWFPSDVPPGPRTTLYVGRVNFTVDTVGVFTLGKTAGTSTDICAALAG